MKFLTFFSLLIWLTSTDPFAPKATVPDNPNNDPDIALMIQFISNAVIPDVESVGFPAYVDAKIFQSANPGELGSPLAMIRTYSEAPMQEVIEFYKQKVSSDWSYKEFYGVHTLWKGDETEAMMSQIPIISITDADDFNNIWPNAKTIIAIYYN